jgi:hypothetical protein
VIDRGRADVDIRVAAVVTRECCVDGEGVRVVHAVAHGPDQSRVVHLARQAREMLAELDAVEARRDGAELAADLRGGFRLHVPHVEVARPAVEEDDDARIGARG